MRITAKGKKEGKLDRRGKPARKRKLRKFVNEHYCENEIRIGELSVKDEMQDTLKGKKGGK